MYTQNFDWRLGWKELIWNGEYRRIIFKWVLKEMWSEDVDWIHLAQIHSLKHKCKYVFIKCVILLTLLYSTVRDILWKAGSHSSSRTIVSFLYRNRRFITVLTKARHLSQPNPVRPIDPYLPKVHLNVILPPTPRSSQWSLPFGPPNQNIVNTSPLQHACHMSRPPHPPWFNHSNNIRLLHYTNQWLRNYSTKSNLS
jgi:hypothetical protein